MADKTIYQVAKMLRVPDSKVHGAIGAGHLISYRSPCGECGREVAKITGRSLAAWRRLRRPLTTR